MGKEITDQEVLRNDIAYNLFVDTADQNYVVARWCYQNSLHLDFLWNGAHALEKYMKAALLLNGRSAIRPAGGGPAFGHDLERLYQELKRIADNLLPTMLIKPNEVRMHWSGESVEAFIARISSDGDAHNRYQIFGYVIRREDLYKFDRVVFAIRRLCCPLDCYVFGNTPDGKPDLTFRDMLERDLEYQSHMMGSRFSWLASQDSTEQVRTAALNHNILFASDDYHHGKVRNGTSVLNPVLGRRILEAAEQGVTGQQARETVELIDWVTVNIFLPKDVRDQLLQARAKLDAAAAAP
jgi:hypothetical protein